jgi:prepilin peptidase CpaA
MVWWLVLLVFPAAMAIAAAMDIVSMTIPNRISLALVAGFILVSLLVPMPWITLAVHVGVALLVLLVGFALFAFGFLGGGDAKLLAASALWFGWPDIGSFLVYTALFGGVLAVVLVSVRRMPLPAKLARIDFVSRLHDVNEGAPYGVAIAAAGLLVYAQSDWMALLAG